MMLDHQTVRADELEVGQYALEVRRTGVRGVLEPVYLRIDAVDKGRYVHYDLEDGSKRVLSPYVEVEILSRVYRGQDE